MTVRKAAQGLILATIYWLGAWMLVSCSEEKEQVETHVEKKESADEAYSTMLATEEVIGELVGQTNRLKRAIRNLDVFFDPKLFHPDAIAFEIAAPGEQPKMLDGIQLSQFEVLPEKVTLKGVSSTLWEDLFQKVHAFEQVGLGTLKGELGDDPNRFVTKLKLSATGKTSTGEQGAWKGKVLVSWIKEDERWLISRLEILELVEMRTPKPFFKEVLNQALTSPDEIVKARRSIHDGYIRDVFFTGGTKFSYPKHYWNYIANWDSLDQHTSVSVVDIDNDGWDDFYVTARWGRNQLWRNQGDGTFEDIAGLVGLDLDGVCNCSLFADFDNDGDKDVFIGRSLERGRYFVNIDGQFYDRSQDDLDAPLPYWSSSMSSADVNGDGLLDLYIATYRLPITRPSNILAKEFLTPAEQEEWKRRRVKDHPVFRLTGPPNVLLLNQGGGRFARAPQAGGAELWLSSFQGTWSDYDNDGDPDLFVANDYAPDHIFRNDDGSLVKVSEELAGQEIQGFGMGVTLGDYDNDGHLDPYFTYMYSKAGSRITGMFGGLEKRMYDGVRGNKLLRNNGDKFEPTDHSVSQAGWSWGGQFADLNNDGFLDLYAANGLYTPPSGTETEVDL